jgi:hypothetical protein
VRARTEARAISTERTANETAKAQESNEKSRERLETRLKSLLAQELEAPNRPPPTLESIQGLAHVTTAPVTDKVPAAAQAANAAETSNRSPGRPALDPPLRQLAALELVQRIDLFLKENRPALALTLRAGQGTGQVEVERLGPGSLSLKLKGVPLGTDGAQTLKASLASRGLSLEQLEIS